MIPSDVWSRLEGETKHFRGWSDALPREGLSWECDYEGWGEIYEVFSAFVAARTPDTWGSNVVQTLLYLIARDNECGRLVEEVAPDPERLIFLARASLESDESDAKWQLASELGSLHDQSASAEALLFRFAHDEE